MRIAIGRCWDFPVTKTQVDNIAEALLVTQGGLHIHDKIQWIGGAGEPPERYNNIVDAAQQWKADYVIFVNLDQPIPPDIFLRLLSHVRDGHPIVAELGCFLIDMTLFQRLSRPYFPKSIDLQKDNLAYA